MPIGKTIILLYFYLFFPAISHSAAIYQISALQAPWLWPLLAIMGLACQIFSVWRKSFISLFIGLGLVLAGSVAEKDITLAIGDILACAGLAYYYWLQSKKGKI